MTVEQLGAELKRAREEQGISLDDISASTRINVKFLEALEEGKFSVLPQTYIRAFLREYAEGVGLDPRAVLAKFEILSSPETPAKPPAEGPPAPVATLPREVETKLNVRSLTLPAILLVSVVIIVLIAVFTPAEPPVGEKAGEVSEIPFDRAVEESEASAQKTQRTPAIQAPRVPVGADSLHLVMHTSDSVWLSITLDGKKTEEFLFPPNWNWAWAAQEKFLVTVGNAGGATFRLNGKDLGSLGKRGFVVRNVEITAARLSPP